MAGNPGDFEQKVGKIRSVLGVRGYDALLITSTVNWGWLTHARVHVNIADGRAVAQLLITRNTVEVLTTSNEAPRLEAEELAGLGLIVHTRDWYEPFEAQWSGHPASRTRVATDIELEGPLRELRIALSTQDQTAYRLLGAASAQVLEAFCRNVLPGCSEREMAGDLARRAWDAGLEPLVINVATDDRARKFRHALPTDKRLESYAVISVAFRRSGLHVTLTRSLHFGQVGPELQDRHRTACRLEALAQSLTYPLADTQTLFHRLTEAYRAEGWPDEWKRHPVGGAVGFQPREYDAGLGYSRTLLAGQGFCWNPTIDGAKSEDSVLVTADGAVPVTAGAFPKLEIKLADRIYHRPAILVRHS